MDRVFGILSKIIFHADKLYGGFSAFKKMEGSSPLFKSGL